MPQTVGGIGAALQGYNSSSDKQQSITSENAALARNMSFGRVREVSNAQPPYSLSRSLGPFQGTPPSSQFRPPVGSSRGSDPMEKLPGQRGLTRGLGGSGRRPSVGFLVASSPPRANNMGQKVRCYTEKHASIEVPADT